jgi:hypothetical protein
MDDCFEKSDRTAQWLLSGEQGNLAETRQDCSTGEIPMQGERYSLRHQTDRISPSLSDDMGHNSSLSF